MERPEKQFYLLEVRGAHSIFGKNLCKQISNKLTSLSAFLSHYALKTQNNYTHFEAIFQHFFFKSRNKLILRIWMSNKHVGHI